MKKLWKICVGVLLCVLMAIPVFADEPGQRPDYYTDYFMIVESPDGGINIYSQASLDSTKLNNDLIPNGTALHIEGEVQEDNSRTWGFVQYHGMNGYVPLDDCRPSTVTEAVNSEIALEGTETVDYDVEVNAKEGYINIYRGPGEKFGKKENTEAIANGEKLRITQEIEVEDKSHWGYVETEDYEGWVKLEDTKKWQDRENASDMVSMNAEVSEEEASLTATPEPSQKKKVTPTPTPTSAPTPTPASTPTPTSAPTETPEPTATDTPTPGVTKTAETPEPSPSSADEKENPEGKQVSSKEVTTSSSAASNPFVWIGVISCIAVIGLLVYHFKKK